MDAANLVVLRGTITHDPVVRELPAGGTVTQVELRTQVEGHATSVPVAVHDRAVSVGTDDDVLITGHVRRRFFRAGGATQSRTEVIASEIVKISRRRTVDRAVARAIEALEARPRQ